MIRIFNWLFRTSQRGTGFKFAVLEHKTREWGLELLTLTLVVTLVGLYYDVHFLQVVGAVTLVLTFTLEIMSYFFHRLEKAAMNEYRHPKG